MLKKLKLFKKPLFQKRRWSCDFPPRKMPVAQKHRAISRQEKMAFSTPVGLSWGSPPPPTESVRTDGRTDVRMYGRTDVRTDGHVTITSQPKFLGLIGYQISLAMELRWRALPAGSAIKNLAYEEPAAILFTSATRKKRAFRLPRSGCLGTPLPLPQSLYGRTDGWTDGRTLTSEPKFFGSTGYQICLPMVLRELRY